MAMTSKAKKCLSLSAIILVLVALDQCLKVYIKTHFALGEAQPITSWFWLCFVENNGMAFGIEWFSKLALTLFRIVVVGMIGWYVYTLIRRQEQGLVLRKGYLTTLACVMAGALGNIVDCVCYGKIWGYADWFYGRVVDMFYFPLIRNAAGEVLFFRPVFNLADSYITCAVVAILLFYTHDLNTTLSSDTKKEESKVE